MISESRAERFVRLLQDYRTNVDVDYRTLVTQKRKFEEHRKLHALLQQVTRLSGRVKLRFQSDDRQRLATWDYLCNSCMRYIIATNF